MSAALAAGLSVELAFGHVAPTLPRGLARPTAAVAAALRVGEPVERALAAYDGVVPAADLAPFAIVLAAFARTGGRIGRSLGRVAHLLRGRLALDAERASLTAQGRLSAVVLVGLAPLGAMFFAIMTPSYVGTLLGPGRILALVAIALEAGGAFWLWRLVRTPADTPELASLLDAVVIGLDAGLSFELSLAALVARSPRVARLPEARHLLADLRLGRSPRAAFAAFADAGPDEARIAALIESASRFGAPLADLLVAQADALREAERRRAETRARRLPVLMTFPLTFCVLPALLVVFLGPPLLSLLG
ncbi:MAG TPA: type II secretion system F family protein [Candidatus Limnocylindria bacterium]|nr:type II secretion system F family protein [Candidatus Limnocylindria bacterium]